MLRLMKSSVLTLALLSLSFRLYAGSEEVVVVYNAKSKDSKALADYYATKRNVPRAQVFGFELTTGEEISRAEFRDGLQKPLAKKLEAAGLWRLGAMEVKTPGGETARQEGRVVASKIRYAVLCTGVPLKILRDNNLKELDDEKMRPEFRRNEAAVDSELTWLPLLNQKHVLAGPMVNPAYMATNTALIHPTNGVLIVTRLDAPTPAIARSLVDKALEAERDGLWGRAYCDLRNTSDPGMKLGDDWMRGAAEICRLRGLETVVEQSGGLFPASFPMSQIAFYAGWYSERVIGAFARPRIEFMPGAFAYHLHSFSAASVRNTGNNWVAPLLEKGVTCTMGTVDEPFLGGTPDIATFASRWLFLGMSFGEAACAAQGSLSWQTTVVGDPLYRPFGRTPKEMHDDLEARHSPLLEWSYLRLADFNLAHNAPAAEVVTLIENWPLTRTSAVLSEKLADLYTAQGKPSSAALTYRQALDLKPSSQQRIRLRLALGEKLLALDRNDEAFADYQAFLDENPDYPDRLDVFRKLLPLAQKLGKKETAAKCEEQIKLLSNPPPK